MKFVIIIMTMIAACAAAWAEVAKVSVLKDLSAKTVVDLYSVSSSKKRHLSPLSQLKDFEIHLKWSECRKLAPQVFATAKDLQGWVAVSWLHCVEQEVKKGLSLAFAQSSLNTIEAQENLFREGPWVAELTQSYSALRLKYLKSLVEKKDFKAGAGLEKLLHERYQLGKEQKALVYQLLADLALLKIRYSEAQFLYEQSQDLQDSPYVQEKLDFLKKAKGTLNEKALPSAPVETGEEVGLEERIRQALKLNEMTSAIQDTMTVLNQFPGSRAAKRLKDKPLEIYLQISDGSGKVKALNLMQDTDGGRLMEWAQSLHRRADYAGALALSEAATEKLASSSQLTSALWVAGRSAHFLGQYDEALKYFNMLIVAHAGSEESAEALFRSSLIYFRKKDFSSSVAMLERLLLQNRDRYELSGRYWLVRALQAANPERAKVETAELINRFPFSYYGLRLRAESQGQKLTWPEAKEKNIVLQSDLFLVSEQKKSWHRFKDLSAAGWWTEAQKELGNLPTIKDATLKITLAEKFAARGQYMPAIRFVNEAMEADPRLRQEQFLKIGFPQVFKDLYGAEGERYGVSPALLRSLTRQESGFNLRAVSTSNALGLMQMIPPTAQEVSKKLGLKIELPDDMFRPEINIPMGSFYVAQMLDQFQGHVPFALAAYNAGPSRMKIWIDLRPEVSALLSKQSGEVADELWFDELPWSETSFYVKAILRNVMLYRLVDEGAYTLKPVLWAELRDKKAK